MIRVAGIGRTLEPDCRDCQSIHGGICLQYFARGLACCRVRTSVMSNLRGLDATNFKWCAAIHKSQNQVKHSIMYVVVFNGRSLGISSSCLAKCVYARMPTIYAHYFVRCRPCVIQLVRRVRGYVCSCPSHIQRRVIQPPGATETLSKQRRRRIVVMRTCRGKSKEDKMKK